MTAHGGGSRRRDPSRRDLLRGAAACALVAQLPRCAPAPRQRPNLLFVFSDAHRASTMGCYGDAVVRTPRFDAFAAQGMQLTTAISSTPLCRPFRAALMTGNYGHHNGMVANVSPHNFGVHEAPDWHAGQWKPEGLPTFGSTFRADGYRCGYVGKWHLGQPNVGAGELRFGFDDYWAVATVFNHDYYEWNYYVDKDQLVSGGGYFRPRMESDLALQFMDEAGDDPWMVMLSWGPPHEPLEPPEEFRTYDGMPLPPNVAPETRGRIREKIELYYGLVEAIDHEFGRLMDELDARGLADNTIVVYTSDHGTMMGSHGLMGKELPYAESARVPLLVRWPGHVPAGVRESMPFGTPDIFPTLAGLGGVPAPRASLDGNDFSGVLLGRADAPRQDATFLTAPDCKPVGYPGWRGVRTETVTYARKEKKAWVLFDHAADPWELVNLTGVRPDLQREMDDRTRALMDAHGDRWRT